MQYDSSKNPRDDMYDGRALVAAFADKASAQKAVDALKEENFHNIWIGVTSQDEDMGSSRNIGDKERTKIVGDESVGAKIGRFFSGESQDAGLRQALVRHGVSENEAARIDRSIAPNSVILTVDGSNHPEMAAEVVEACGGHILAGESFSSGRTSPQGAGGLRGSQILGYQGSNFARGAEIDDEQVIELRSERLNIAKERVSAGEATIRKEVVEHTQALDVPTVREELFVERRPVSDSTAAEDAAPIGEGEVIRIPLTRESIRVTKRPVVTEEVVVGKRLLSQTEHVNETIREEHLSVDEK